MKTVRCRALCISNMGFHFATDHVPFDLIDINIISLSIISVWET